MARRCSNCGYELWEGNKFCPECGAAVVEVVQAAQWEYCEVDLVVVEDQAIGFAPRGGVRSYWRAIGANPSGRYVAGKSREFLHQGNAVAAEASAILDEFVLRLAAAGWERLPGKGRFWYNHQFRRPVRS
jgi:RNA polymerase subunit RPABC4/transcription elongation factor Spt4